MSAINQTASADVDVVAEGVEVEKAARVAVAPAFVLVGLALVHVVVDTDADAAADVVAEPVADADPVPATFLRSNPEVFVLGLLTCHFQVDGAKQLLLTGPFEPTHSPLTWLDIDL